MNRIIKITRNILKNIISDKYLLLIYSLILLMAYKSSLFLDSHHGWVSSEQLSIVISSKFENYLVGTRLIRSDGTFVYFPKMSPFIYAIINSLVTFFAEPTYKILISRVIASLVTCMNLLLIFKLLKKLGYDNLKSIIALGISFSTLYVAYYSDMIYPDLFLLTSFILAGHVFVALKEDKRQKAFILTMFSANLGYFFLNTFPYIIGTIAELYKFLKGRENNFKTYIIITLLSITVSCSLMAYNTLTEMKINNVTLEETNIYKSFKRRLDLKSDYKETYGEKLSILNYYPKELKRLGKSIMPVALYNPLGFFLFLFILFKVVKRIRISSISKFKGVPFIISLSGLYPFFVLKGYAQPHGFSSTTFLLFSIFFWIFILDHISYKKIMQHENLGKILVLLLLFSSHLKISIEKYSIKEKSEERYYKLLNFRKSLRPDDKLYLDFDIKYLTPGSPYSFGVIFYEQTFASTENIANWVLKFDNDSMKESDPEKGLLFIKR